MSQNTTPPHKAQTPPFIMVAPTGARRTRVDHPAMPVTLPQILETAVACQAAGADAIHLHVREEDGSHSLDAGRYQEALAELAIATPKMAVQISTEAVGIFDVADQLACLRTVAPKWASVSIREIARTPELADAVYGTCHDAGTKVQHILYGPDDIGLLRDWQAKGLVRPDQIDVICVLGRYTVGQTSTPADLDPFLADLAPQTPWMVCAFGPTEHACLHYAAQRGGTLRVGFENSLTNNGGVAHADNAASITALCALIANHVSQ